MDEAEKTLREFKPITYDVSTQMKAIETFETKAVRFFLPERLPTPAPRFSCHLLGLTFLTRFAHQCVYRRVPAHT